MFGFIFAVMFHSLRKILLLIILVGVLLMTLGGYLWSSFNG